MTLATSTATNVPQGCDPSALRQCLYEAYPFAESTVTLLGSADAMGSGLACAPPTTAAQNGTSSISEGVMECAATFSGLGCGSFVSFELSMLHLSLCLDATSRTYFSARCLDGVAGVEWLCNFTEATRTRGLSSALADSTSKINMMRSSAYTRGFSIFLILVTFLQF